MPTAPNLLDDDGSASVATAFMMSHHGLRRDIAHFGIALRRIAEGDRSRAAAVQVEWKSYRGTLHGHHHVEDTAIFPSMRARDEALAPILDQLGADHRRIDPLLEAGDRAFAALSVPEARDVVAQIGSLLDAHLALEEAHVIPLLRAAKTFPPPATDAEAALYADGFAWSSQGIAPDVIDRVYAMLPEPLTSRLPSARAAFADRYERVWGPQKPTPGASRTAVPDWLA